MVSISGKKSVILTESGIKYRKLKAELIERMGGKCEQCDTTEHLAFHHNVKPVYTYTHKRGGYQNLLDIRILLNLEVELGLKGKDRLVFLYCKECHDEFHSLFGDIQLTREVMRVGKSVQLGMGIVDNRVEIIKLK